MQKKLFILAAIALVLIGGAFLFWMKQQKIEIPQIQPVAQNGGSSEEQERYPQHIEAIQGTDEVRYNIPECGVSIHLNKEFAEDTQYIFSNERGSQRQGCDTIYFASKKLSAIAPACAFGSIGIVNIIQNGEERGNVTSDRIKSFSNFDIIFSGSQNQQYNCLDSVPESKLREVFPEKYDGMGAKSIFDGFKTIELIPSK